MRELHLFAGAGGGILGGILLGHSPVCAVEIEPYPRKVLLQRQRDGILPHFPIWDDVRTLEIDGQRIWILAKASGLGWPEILRSDSGWGSEKKEIWTSNNDGSRGWADRIYALEQVAGEPGILGSGDGVAYPVDRLKAIGNGQVPRVVKLAWETLSC